MGYMVWFWPNDRLWLMNFRTSRYLTGGYSNKKFIEYEHKNGVDPKDYFKPDAGHELDGYRQKYRDLAMEVVDMAHAEAGSHR